MPRYFYFITHPNVVISTDIPVPCLPLSELGRARMKAAFNLPWLNEITSIYCSAEQKAIDGAEILAERLGLKFEQVVELGENDRSSTGFLPPGKFEEMADQFFSNPTISVCGWESATNAQTRVVEAVKNIARRDTTNGSVAIVSHGAVGTLLYCHLTNTKISREWDQPPNGGGNYFRFALFPNCVESHWRSIDAVAA